VFVSPDDTAPGSGQRLAVSDSLIIGRVRSRAAARWARAFQLVVAKTTGDDCLTMPLSDTSWLRTASLC
jgi:hypothetical protein